MTNHDRFRLYTSEFPSPDTYIDAAWTFLISSCLQRRVWMKSGKRIWPNQYIFLVAPPGVGKSVTETVKDLLVHYKQDGTINKPALEGQELARTKMLFPVSASSTTYAKFVEVLSSNLMWYRGSKPAYPHCSVSFVLDEITSIFKRDAQDMMTFLLEGWSCVDEYSNETIGRGVNYVKNMCVNLIGGTQPDKFADMRQVDIVSSGFTRRAVIIFETKSRSRHFVIPEHTPAQQEARGAILQHMLKLSTLYGEVTMTAEAQAWMNDYWIDERRVRLNKSPYLDNYYVSKNLHIHKTAMALHFGESTDMVIPLQTYQHAIELLGRYERTMHVAFTPKAKTDVSDVKDDLIRLLELAPVPQSAMEIYMAFDRKIGFSDFQEALTDLQVSGRVVIGDKGKFRLK